MAAALELIGTGAPVAVLCIDSDGSDGPTDAAGGLVDDGSAARHGAVFRAALASHATYQALAEAGDLVISGPTGTNVNDLKVALHGGP